MVEIALFLVQPIEQQRMLIRGHSETLRHSFVSGGLIYDCLTCLQALEPVNQPRQDLRRYDTRGGGSEGSSMALDTISTQFSVVDAAQEGAMRTSHLRRCETASFCAKRETH